MILVSPQAVSKHLKPERAISSHIYVISGFEQKRQFRIARYETFLSRLKVKKNWHIFLVKMFYSDYEVSFFGKSFWGVEYPFNSAVQEPNCTNYVKKKLIKQTD